MSKSSLLIPETKIQSALLEWLSWSYPKTRYVTFAIPNGGKRTFSYGKKLKREGMTAGIPDVLICTARKGFNGFFIEFKSAKGKVTEAQQKKIELLKSEGYKVEVCYSVDEAIREVTAYLTKE